MAKLLFQGHGSFRLTADDGRIIYIDPYVGEGYDALADFILVSHQHSDHNQIGKPAKKPACRIISTAEFLEGGSYRTFDLGCGLIVEAVEAYNKNHKKAECVGFIITVDGVKLYASGDTSRTAQMETFAARKLNYAILCCDGVYNMNLDEAAECARIISAKRTIPAHMKPGALFDDACAQSFSAPNKLIMTPGEKITL